MKKAKKKQEPRNKKQDSEACKSQALVLPTSLFFNRRSAFDISQNVVLRTSYFLLCTLYLVRGTWYIPPLHPSSLGVGHSTLKKYQVARQIQVVYEFQLPPSKIGVLYSTLARIPYLVLRTSYFLLCTQYFVLRTKKKPFEVNRRA